MNRYKFYLECESPSHKQNGKHTGNAVAVAIDSARLREGDHHTHYDAYSATNPSRPNSPVEPSIVDSGWLEENCIPTTVEEAQKIHPTLVAHLYNLKTIAEAAEEPKFKPFTVTAEFTIPALDPEDAKDRFEALMGGLMQREVITGWKRLTAPRYAPSPMKQGKDSDD